MLWRVNRNEAKMLEGSPVIRLTDFLDSIASRSASFRFTRLCPTSELNVVTSVDQDAYRPDFQNAPTQTISLHAVAKKAGTNNKVAITYLCKKPCNPLGPAASVAKIRSNVNRARRDCGNAGTVGEGTDAVIISRSESGEDNHQADPDVVTSLPRPQSSKRTKRRRTNILSPRK